jgi:PAS domain S-box-containing protein
VAAAHQALGALAVTAQSSSVGAARRFVQQRLHDFGLPDDVIDTAVLLTSELVTNAVLHTGTDIEVRVGAGVGAMIEVRDQSDRHPLPRRHADDAVSGRGLELVEILADNFGVVPIPGFGKSVWFVVGDPSEPMSDGWSDPAPSSAVTDVVLRHLPVVLYDVLREHNEALLREYTLQLLERPGEHALALRDVATVERARLTVVFSVMAWHSSISGTQPSTHVDLPLQVSVADVNGFELFPAVVAAAERQASDGRLLTRPALPEVASLREWLFGQIVEQLRGGSPSAWEYSDDPLAPLPLPVAVDTSWVGKAKQAVIVGDDTNRILALSPSAAALLGWTSDELVGQRLMAIIPPRLREAHVAGFTRQLVTGRRHVLDQAIELAALHRDGHELTVTVTLTKQACDDRAVFCAWLSA